MQIANIILLVIVLGVFGFSIYQKRANAKDWLKWAVVQAEIALGSGTGQLKLRSVYDLFIKQFPWFSIFVSFETFSAWVDEALEWMKNQINCNSDIELAITGEIKNAK